MRCATALLVFCVACGAKSGGSGDDGGGGGPCTTEADCSGSTPVCGADGICVQCATGNDCPTDTPICDFGTCIASCAGSEASASLVEGPSDIIWVVDQSGSMDQETTYVQQKINDFVALIDPSGIDYHVIMIADPNAGNAICVPPPLGGTNCGNNTRFRLVPEQVGSHDGPELLVDHYADYSDFLRPGSAKHIIFVTDDDSNLTATQFMTQLNALQPAGTFDNVKIHGIYAYGTAGGDGCDGVFGSGANEGLVYTDLITQTGGASGVICTGDWTTVFADISQAVVSGSRVSCDLAIPAPPMGEALDPTRVNVRYVAAGMGAGESLPKVGSAGDCTSSGGWYYDDDAAPTQITLCPATCDTVQMDAQANLKIEFGCSSVIL